jgi:hypothetical protein
MLATLLHPTDRGAEFGSGRSTLWFAARVAELTSVETNTRWHERVTNQLKECGVSNVEYILVPEDKPMETGDGPYAKTALMVSARASLERTGRPDAVAGEHRELLAAILRGDGALASRVAADR